MSGLFLTNEKKALNRYEADMTTYEWFQVWVLMVLAIRATRRYDKLKHDLFDAIKAGRI